MPTHRGQMAFFAGHKKIDEKHPYIVAQREFVEESGLDPRVLDLVGLLSPVMTARNQAIIPVVAKLKIDLEDFFQQAISNGEWTDLIAVPWRDLQNSANWEWGYHMGAITRKVLLFPITPHRYLHQKQDSSRPFLLWGATARMVWDYLSLY